MGRVQILVLAYLVSPHIQYNNPARDSTHSPHSRFRLDAVRVLELEPLLPQECQSEPVVRSIQDSRSFHSQISYALHSPRAPSSDTLTACSTANVLPHKTRLCLTSILRSPIWRPLNPRPPGFYRKDQVEMMRWVRDRDIKLAGRLPTFMHSPYLQICVDNPASRPYYRRQRTVERKVRQLSNLPASE